MPGKKIVKKGHGHPLWFPVQFLFYLPYRVEHLLGVRGIPVAEVVLNLPESEFFIKMPDEITDDDVTGNRERDDLGQGQAQVDVEKSPRRVWRLP